MDWTQPQWKGTHQLPLFGWERWGWGQIMAGIDAGERVIEPINLHQVLVLLLVDMFILWCLVEHGRLRLWIIFYKLHVSHHWNENKHTHNEKETAHMRMFQVFCPTTFCHVLPMGNEGLPWDNQRDGGERHLPTHTQDTWDKKACFISLPFSKQNKDTWAGCYTP